MNRAGDEMWGPSPLPPPGVDDGPHSVDEVGELGRALGPALHEACGDKLGDIEWFSTPWQRSGAATGFTSWRLPNGTVIEAVAKVPVGYREWYWTAKLGETDPMWWESFEAEHLPVPRVLASGTELGGYDVAWLVVERVMGEPLHKSLEAGDSVRALTRVFDAAARLHKLAGEVRPPSERDTAVLRDWPGLIERAARGVSDNLIADTGRWLELIGRVGRSLDGLVERWRERPKTTWCHGDLHPGNVMTRPCHSCRLDGVGRACGADEGVLIDLGLMHAGHWIEDALYLERLYWGRPEALGGVVPIEALSEARARVGLDGDVEAARGFARVRRVLMAATSPAFLSQGSDEVYLAAALGQLEAGVREGLI